MKTLCIESCPYLCNSTVVHEILHNFMEVNALYTLLSFSNRCVKETWVKYVEKVSILMGIHL